MYLADADAAVALLDSRPRGRRAVPTGAREEALAVAARAAQRAGRGDRRDATGAGGTEVPASALPTAAQCSASPTRKLNYLQRNILAVKQTPRGHRVMPAEIKLIV